MNPHSDFNGRLDETRLPPEVREQILAELPSVEEQEHLYREMQEKGGLSFEQLLDALGLDVEHADVEQ